MMSGGPELPACVIVHGLAMAQRAVAVAASIGRPVTLLSAPGAGIFAGVGWWRALVSLASPHGEVTHVLDCGDAAGRALEALRAGQRLLVLRADARVWADIAARAASRGGVLLADAPPALDLGVAGAVRRLPAWLAQVAVQEDRPATWARVDGQDSAQQLGRTPSTSKCSEQ